MIYFWTGLVGTVFGAAAFSAASPLGLAGALTFGVLGALVGITMLMVRYMAESCEKLENRVQKLERIILKMNGRDVESTK